MMAFLQRMFVLSLSTLVLISIGCTKPHYDNVPVGYQLMVQQNFDSPKALNEFEFTIPDAYKYSETGNGTGAGEFATPEKIPYNPPVRSPYMIGLISDKVFGDFILDVDLLQTGRDYGHRDMVIVFGLQDNSHFYYTHMATAADQNAHNIFIVDGKPRTNIATSTTKGIDWGREMWHKVRVERTVTDGTINVYFDDLETPIMTAKNTAFKSGYIGFGTFDDSGKFDNIRIYSPKMEAKPSNVFTKKK